MKFSPSFTCSHSSRLWHSYELQTSHRNDHHTKRDTNHARCQQISCEPTQRCTCFTLLNFHVCFALGRSHEKIIMGDDITIKRPKKEPRSESRRPKHPKQIGASKQTKLSKESRQAPESQPELTDTLFLRNVSRFDTTQESLKAHMEENFGETVYCLICKDKETDESKGTAFVKFKEPENAAKCLAEFADRELQTKFFLDGRNLFVLPALNRNQIGEVKQASAKSDTNVIKKKKFKKARYHRVPATR